MTDISPKPPRGTMPTPVPTDTAKTYWDGFYQSVQTPADWVARPNPLLVDEVSDLPAGTALDLGCGAGGDAIWLAENGWQVTAADVSAAVLARAATAAAQAGVSDRIDWQEHDLTRSLPAGTFDLVTAQYLHSPIAGAAEREAVFASAATAVAPGGTLLVISHAGFPTWLPEQPPDYLADQLIPNSVILDWVQATPGTWAVDVDKVVTRERTGPAGEAGTADDALLRIRRLH
jgi:SAM-dependent methyltransferase